MILVDFSALVYKNLFSAIRDSTDDNGKKIKKHNGYYKTNEYKNLFLYKIFTDLKYIYKFNRKKYGEMVLGIDSKNGNWRKDFYAGYKSTKRNKDSGVNFTEFFEIVDDVLENIDKNFPFKVVKVPKAEGDDIVGVLVMRYKNHKNLVVTHDKDFKQLFKYGVEIYNPIKLKNEKKLNSKELEKWLIEHIMLGDKADDVPKVVEETEFSDKFKSFLKSEDIYVDDVHEFKKLSMSERVISKFLENNEYDEIYKKMRFGPAKLNKFMDDFEENINSNMLYKEHYARNEILVLFENIPIEIQEEILNVFMKAKSKANPAGISNYFMKNNLMTLYTDAQDFFVEVDSVDKLESSDDW